MAWVRISDDFYDHPKFQQLTGVGVSMWVAGLAYANRNLTDGFVPVRMACALVDQDSLGYSMYGPGQEGSAAANGLVSLVDAGLWHEEGHGCERCPQPPAGSIIMHDYLDYQPSRVDVEKRADERSQAGRKGAQKRWGGKPDGNSHSNSHSNSHGNSHRGSDGKAIATGMANGWQTDAPNPNPNPNDSFTSSQSGLVSNAREILDRIDPKKIRAELKSLAVEVSDEELADWAGATLALSPSPVRNPTGYLMTAIRTDANTDGGEIEGWLHNHRRSRIKAVGG